MPWLTLIWLVIAIGSAAFALIHGYAWFRLRNAPAQGAMVLCASSVSLVALVDLGMIRAETPEEFARFAWLLHLPVWMAMVGGVLFVRLYMRAGQPVLAWTVIGLRTLVLVLNIFSPSTSTFSEIRSLRQMSLLGDSVAITEVVAHPLSALGVLSLLALALLIIDASVEVWRRGERRMALTIGGLLSFFVLVAAVTSVLRLQGIIQFPAVATLSCVPIILAMSFALSGELARSAELSASLQARHAELTESEASLQLAARAAKVSLWSIDTVSGALWTTERAVEMFDFDAARPLHFRDFLQRVHPDDRPRVRSAVMSHPGDGQASVEYRVILPDGEERWFASVGRLQPDNPTSRVMTGVTIDITSRRRAELDAERRRLELDRLTRVSNAREFSSAVAHELGQPLAIIMSNAEAAQSMLEKPAPPCAELRDVFNDIIAASQRASTVLDRLRALPRREQLKSVPFSANDMVSDVLSILRLDLEQRGVTAEVRVAVALPPVLGDRLLIEQVLFNLVRNACEAMAGNAEADRRLLIETVIAEGMADGMAELRVYDLGTGLTHDPEQLFQPFFTTKAEGVGIGLVICRSIIEAHDGQIGAFANRPRGACFWIRLPLATDAADAPAAMTTERT